jgi:hypothetical protein
MGAPTGYTAKYRPYSAKVKIANAAEKAREVKAGWRGKNQVIETARKAN